MDPTVLQRVEKLCYQLYNSPSLDERKLAENILQRAFPTFIDATSASIIQQISPLSPSLPQDGLGFSANKPVEGIVHTSILLEQSKDVYLQTFVTNHMRTLVSNHFMTLTLQEKRDLKNFIVHYLTSNAGAPNAILTSLSQILTLMIKLAWFETEEFSNVMNEFSPFLHASVPQQIVCAKVLSTMVSEMNNPSLAVPKMTKLRKAVVGFRDTQLIQVFQAGLSFLHRYLGNALQFENDVQRGAYMSYSIGLIKVCLTFDFIGTTPDESSDDVCSIQIPSSWRSLIEESFIALLFQCYKMFSPLYKSDVMECISFAVAIRRSLFNEKERSKWVGTILQQSTTTLTDSIGLEDFKNYHEICKMLCKLKSTYHLSELSLREEFDTWLEQVAKFSVRGLTSWQWSPNSEPYLLAFWSRCASSGFNPSGKLEYYTNLVAQRYIGSHLAAFEVIVNDGEENQLKDEESLASNLEHIGSIARRTYEEVSSFIVGTYNNIFQSYKNNKTKVFEHQLTYLIYIIAALVGSHIPYQSPDTHDVIDGELSLLVLSSIEYHQTISASRYLDAAFLHFFAHFRKSYIGENAQRASRIYEALARFNIHDQQQMMQVMIQQIFRILRLRSNKSTIVAKALKLFDDLSIGYVSAKLLAKLDIIKSMMKNHELEFLHMDFKHRTQYYSTLSRVFFSEDPSFTQFTEYMRPFETRYSMLASVTNIVEFHNKDFQTTLIGFFRDLRGILFAIITKRNYLLFWDWIYPSKMDLLLKCMETLATTSSVANPLLKFFLEFSNNRHNRMTFDTSSVNGILLFRETSRLLQIYGTQIMNYQPSSPSQIYDEVYKCITSCFGIYKNVLSGHYINFGVFALYGDESLNNAMKMITNLILFIPQPHILAYPKLSQSYFDLIEVMTQLSQLPLWFNVPLNFFVYLGQTLGEAVKTMTSSVCFNTIDNLASFVYTEQEKFQKSISSPSTNCIVMAFQQLPSIIPYWLTLHLNAAIFEESAIHWSITRPLLALIFLGREFFNQYCTSLVQSQLPDRRATVRDLLSNLMKDIDDTLNSKNKDRLTHNINQFRKEVLNLNLTLMPPPDISLNT